MGDIIFTMNELVAISSALESQIEDCQKFLSDLNLSSEEKKQVTKSLEYSKSAASRLDLIFKENNFNPKKN